jgi:hypothetical protein
MHAKIIFSLFVFKGGIVKPGYEFIHLFVKVILIIFIVMLVYNFFCNNFNIFLHLILSTIIK